MVLRPQQAKSIIILQPLDYLNEIVINMKIFENISKEKFIEEINKKYCGTLQPSFLYLIEFNYLKYKTKSSVSKSNDCSYDYYKGRVQRKIVDITNYEEELELFNSFDCIREYGGEYITIVDNYNNYVAYKNSSSVRLTSSVYKIMKDIETFDKYVSLQQANKLKLENKEKLKNISKEVSKILLVKKEELSNKILSVVEDSFKDFNDFDNYGRLRYSLSFSKYDSYYKANKFTKKHIIKNNFFNEFTLKIYGYYYGVSKRLKGVKLEDYIDRLNTFTDCVNVVADYFEHEVYMVSYQHPNNIVVFEFNFIKIN